MAPLAFNLSETWGSRKVARLCRRFSRRELINRSGPVPAFDIDKGRNGILSGLSHVSKPDRTNNSAIDFVRHGGAGMSPTLSRLFLQAGTGKLVSLTLRKGRNVVDLGHLLKPDRTTNQCLWHCRDGADALSQLPGFAIGVPGMTDNSMPFNTGYGARRRSKCPPCNVLGSDLRCGF